MAVCPHCNGEMTERISCKADPIVIAGRAYSPIRWGEERRPKSWPQPDFCSDCGTPLGGVHHPGCCVERCPVCLGQAFGCVDFQEDSEDEDDWEESSCLAGRPYERCHTHLNRRAAWG